MYPQAQSPSVADSHVYRSPNHAPPAPNVEGRNVHAATRTVYKPPLLDWARLTFQSLYARLDVERSTKSKTNSHNTCAFSVSSWPERFAYCDCNSVQNRTCCGWWSTGSRAARKAVEHAASAARAAKNRCPSPTRSHADLCTPACTSLRRPLILIAA